MAEPLKDRYNPRYIQNLAAVLADLHQEFNKNKFTKAVFSDDWGKMELKTRMLHITEQLHGTLNLPYSKALKVLKVLRQAAPQFSGFEAMFFPAFVELYGLEDWENSISALEHFTQYSSSEFAVRPFIKRQERKMMRQMLTWSKHENYHVRRLSSEGCRPRLPWAMALPNFKQDPELILPILQQLKHDPSEYVRRSVANNLNDISKDHPQLIIKISKSWSGQSANTDWIIKHANRTLFKAGNPKALQLFGYKKSAKITATKLKVNRRINIGEQLNFGFTLNTIGQSLGLLRIEYAIHYQKANASLSAKVFKISEGHYKNKEMQVSGKRSFKQMSTRVHHPGKHQFVVLVNGEEKAKSWFMVNG